MKPRAQPRPRMTRAGEDTRIGVAADRGAFAVRGPELQYFQLRTENDSFAVSEKSCDRRACPARCPVGGHWSRTCLCSNTNPEVDMPYRTIADLPKAQVEQYDAHQKEAFLKAFNNAPVARDYRLQVGPSGAIPAGEVDLY